MAALAALALAGMSLGATLAGGSQKAGAPPEMPDPLEEQKRQASAARSEDRRRQTALSGVPRPTLLTGSQGVTNPMGRRSTLLGGGGY